MAKQFVFRSYLYDAIELMEPEMRLKAYDAIMRRAFRGEPVDDDFPEALEPFIIMAFEYLDQESARYDKMVKMGRRPSE